MVTKGVIVAAGYGSRLLPITRTIPKEMLPLLDRPAIDWVIQEFVEAGITDVLVITSRRKRVLEDWFDRDPELEQVFTDEGADAKLAKIAPPPIRATFVRQARMGGTGDALLLARAFAGKDPVVVAYPDDLFGAPNVSAALIAAHAKTGCSVLSAQAIDDEAALSRYGVLELGEATDGVATVRRIVEKPPPGTAPSNLVSFGRYLYTPEFFDALEASRADHVDGEFFPTVATTELGRAGRLVAAPITARRYDTGTTTAWLKTLVELALEHPEHGPAIRELLA